MSNHSDFIRLVDSVVTEVNFGNATRDFAFTILTFAIFIYRNNKRHDGDIAMWAEEICLCYGGKNV